VARHHRFILLIVSLSVSVLLLVPSVSLAYIGPGSGLELVPQFFWLLALVGMAFLSILLWPFMTLYRFIRRMLRGEPAPGAQAPAGDAPDETAPIMASLTEENGSSTDVIDRKHLSSPIVASESQGNANHIQS
jgi:hypothetical protein